MTKHRYWYVKFVPLNLVLMINVGPTLQQSLDSLCVSLLRSHSQWDRVGRSLGTHISCIVTLVICIVTLVIYHMQFCQQYISTQCTCMQEITETHQSLYHTIVAKLGSAPLFSNVSTASVCPSSTATYNAPRPSCRVHSTVLWMHMIPNIYNTCMLYAVIETIVRIRTCSNYSVPNISLNIQE